MSHVTRFPAFSPETSQAIVADYLQGFSSPFLAKKYHCSKPTILQTLRRCGCPARQGNRSRMLNDHAFDDAESNPIAAYYVGLLMADGAIIRRKNRPASQTEIALSLKKSDRSLLESYREFIGSTHAIRSYEDPERFGEEPALFLTVSSNHMAISLERYGVTSRKSFTAKVALLENNPHFWRGMIDGDGWLYVTKSEGTRKPVIGFTGSWDSVHQFQQFCGSVCPSKVKIHPNGSIWRLTLKCRPAYRLIHRLYSDSGPALPRKKAIAEAILQEFSHFLYPQKWEERRALSRDELLALLQAHGTWEAVAKLLGICTSSFRNVRRRLGLESLQRGPVYYRLLRGEAKFYEPGRKV